MWTTEVRSHGSIKSVLYSQSDVHMRAKLFAARSNNHETTTYIRLSGQDEHYTASSLERLIVQYVSAMTLATLVDSSASDLGWRMTFQQI